MPINYTQLADRIRISRLEKHMSQEQLAEAVDISRTHMSCLECGERSPSIETLAELAKVLDVSVDWLLGITNNPPISHLADCSPEENSFLTQSLIELKDILRDYRLCKK